jgi:hypothetical protein
VIPKAAILEIADEEKLLPTTVDKAPMGTSITALRIPLPSPA